MFIAFEGRLRLSLSQCCLILSILASLFLCICLVWLPTVMIEGAWNFLWELIFLLTWSAATLFSAYQREIVCLSPIGQPWFIVRVIRSVVKLFVIPVAWIIFFVLQGIRSSAQMLNFSNYASELLLSNGAIPVTAVDKALASFYFFIVAMLFLMLLLSGISSFPAGQNYSDYSRKILRKYSIFSIVLSVVIGVLGFLHAYIILYPLAFCYNCTMTNALVLCLFLPFVFFLFLFVFFPPRCY